MSERAIIDQLVVRLTSSYPDVPAEKVSTLVWGIHSRFEGSPLRDFIPLLVERNAKKELEQLGALAP